jgi:hypothetical protein
LLIQQLFSIAASQGKKVKIKMVNNVIKDAYESIDHSILAYIEDTRCFEEMACIFVLLILKMT